MEIHIGNIIKKHASEQRISMTVLAEKVGLHKASISRQLSSKHLHTEMLQKFCIALNYDFFAIYSQNLNLIPIDKPEEKAKEEIPLSVSEKLIMEKDAQIEKLTLEVGYLKQINELLSKKK